MKVVKIKCNTFIKFNANKRKGYLETKFKNPGQIIFQGWQMDRGLHLGTVRINTDDAKAIYEKQNLM